MVELGDGSLVVLINYQNEMQVWKRDFGKTEWTIMIAKNNMFGYTLCKTGLGLLIGVSNKEFNTDNSGLYVLREDEGQYNLYNITIGEAIGHVQFIKNIDDTIFVYGNYYSHVYSFNLNSLERDDDNACYKTNSAQANTPWGSFRNDGILGSRL